MLKTNILCILDGFGLAPQSPNNIAYLAKMPNFRSLLKNCWWTTFDADGEFVGQEAGLVGNSEVGHMNIGGLKLIPQLSYQVTDSAAQAFTPTELSLDQLFDPKLLLEQAWISPQRSKIVHLVGLFSTGTIHSDLRHWMGAIEAAGQYGAEKIVMHLITDGRDSDRQSLVSTWEYFTDTFAGRLEPFKEQICLGSVGGRFYSMDRDKNWDRVIKGVLPMLNLEKLGQIKQLNYENHFHISDKFVNFFQEKYDLEYSKIFEGFEFYRDNQHEKSIMLGHHRKNWELSTAIWQPVSGLIIPSVFTKLDQDKNCLESYASKNYEKNIFDENILPKSVDNNSISQNDTVFFINFRTDRMKQLAQMFCEINQEFQLNLLILGMNDYGISKEVLLESSLENFEALKDHSSSYYPVFKNKPVQGTLAEAISSKGKTQLHIAETEKYNHVTYFLNGGQSKKTSGEKWVIINSNKVNSHAEKPEMKAREITDYILEHGLGKYDFILVNYANPDMVGHTGDVQASIKAVEALDVELGRLVEKCYAEGHKMLITADHGNIEVVGEYELNGKTLTDTEHNPNPVPCIVVDKDFKPDELHQRVIENAEKYGFDLDTETLEFELSHNHRLDLDNSLDWLHQSQIPIPKMGLWYAGIIFLSL